MTTAAVPLSPFDAARLRRDFPILAEPVHGKPLVYLDNANTTQKPKAVIEATTRYYEKQNSNIHRGTHHLSEVATAVYEGARARIARFIHANSPREVVFTRGTTEAINLVANSYGQLKVKAGDEILITHLEHHSNIVPWQLLCERTGATLKVVPITDAGEVDLAAFEKLLSDKTRLFAVGHISNSLGTVNPVKEMVAKAKAAGAATLIDGAQAVPHQRVDVRELGCDFYAFSGHKMYGPTGIGVLWGREALLETMPPFQGGGDMILSVTFEKTDYNELPFKFEAGTANIAGGAGIAAAVDYLEAAGLDAIAGWESELLAKAEAGLRAIPGLKIIGTAQRKAGLVSFTMEGIHPHDVGTILDRDGLAVRTGHHCAQPVMDRFGVPATVRASFGLYNLPSDVDALVAGVEKVRRMFS